MMFVRKAAVKLGCPQRKVRVLPGFILSGLLFFGGGWGWFMFPQVPADVMPSHNLGSLLLKVYCFG